MKVIMIQSNLSAIKELNMTHQGLCLPESIGTFFSCFSTSIFSNFDFLWTVCVTVGLVIIAIIMVLLMNLYVGEIGQSSKQRNGRKARKPLQRRYAKDQESTMVALTESTDGLRIKEVKTNNSGTIVRNFLNLVKNLAVTDEETLLTYDPNDESSDSANDIPLVKVSYSNRDKSLSKQIHATEKTPDPPSTATESGDKNGDYETDGNFNDLVL